MKYFPPHFKRINAFNHFLLQLSQSPPETRYTVQVGGHRYVTFIGSELVALRYIISPANHASDYERRCVVPGDIDACRQQ